MEEEILEEEIQVQEEKYVSNADLSDYYTKEETDDLLDEKADIEDIPVMTDYYTKTQTDNLLDEKADISDIPDISGKQDLITSSNKLSSDLVDDSLGTNKFVTSQEKTTWNGKQNALTFDSTPTLNSNNPVTSDGIAIAIQNAGSGKNPMYLGKRSEHNTSETAIDLTNLDVGVYVINMDTSADNIYLKADYNGNTITGNYSPFYLGSCINNILYLRINTKISDSLPTNTVIGDFSYTYYYEADKIIRYENRYIKIGNSISTGTGNNIEYRLVTTNGNQTITGKKTFSTLPESSVTPTTTNQLVNKQYVDDIVGNINTVLATLTTVQGDN